MRVTRRSYLSRLASDDDGFAGIWWEDGTISNRNRETRRHPLHGPQIAHPVDRDDASPAKDSPFIDSRLAPGNKGATSKRKRDRR